ncbi:hypothetical protein EZS27_037345, partial [termite gut metagenome]
KRRKREKDLESKHLKLYGYEQ